MNAAVSYNRITETDLKDNNRLVALLEKAVSRGIWRMKSETDVLNFFSLAEKALHDDRSGNPGALFRYLIDNRKVSMISDRNEDLACARIDSAARHRIFMKARIRSRRDVSPDIEPKTPLIDIETLGYLPRGLTSCVFPREKPSPNMEAWTIQNSDDRVITLSTVVRRMPGFPSLKIPYGGMPRLIFAYLVGQAVRKIPVISLGRTKNWFLNHLGYSENVDNRNSIRRQLAYLSFCDITIETFTQNKSFQRMRTDRYNLTRTVKMTGPMPPIYEHAIGRSRRVFESDLTDRLEWATEFRFSKDFMSYVKKRPMPVRLDHLKALSRSPRRMDIYTWLSRRVYHIRKHPIRVPLVSLHQQFAPEIDPGHHRQFKGKLKNDLIAIRQIHPHFNVETSSTELIIYASIPPVDSLR